MILSKRRKMKKLRNLRKKLLKSQPKERDQKIPINPHLKFKPKLSLLKLGNSLRAYHKRKMMMKTMMKTLMKTLKIWKMKIWKMMMMKTLKMTMMRMRTLMMIWEQLPRREHLRAGSRKRVMKAANLTISQRTIITKNKEDNIPIPTSRTTSKRGETKETIQTIKEINTGATSREENQNTLETISTKAEISSTSRITITRTSRREATKMEISSRTSPSISSTSSINDYHPSIYSHHQIHIRGSPL